jgi:signal transduction histidine kinase
VVVNPLGERALVVLADITEQVRARARLQQQEEHLRQKQKLEAVGTLAGGVAHDFNNLLTTILGNTELALMGLPADHPEAAGLKQVLQAARRARELVRQILVFSRQAAPSREVVAVASLVEETINLLRTIARNEVEFEVKLPPDLPALLADPGQVHQVLMNIGTNAVQAMRGAPGRLTFQAEAVEVGPALRAQFPELQPGNHVRITIRDTGPGMPLEVQRRVFEPFFTTKAAGEGTGLGLSVVHGIMQQHGGAVTLHSQPGQGCQFQLYFRAAAGAARTEDGSANGLVPRGQGERVLFVDDDPAIAGLAGKILRQLGYAVSIHHRAETALAEWQAAPDAFAVIVSDLTMPGMNGLQLLGEVHAVRPHQPFVLISGFFSEIDSNEASSLGVAAMLPKPLSYAPLGRAVAACLGRG